MISIMSRVVIADAQHDRQDQHEGINRVVKPFDWSYTTDYQGTVHSPSPNLDFTPSPIPIPLELLKRPDPILFFDEVVLYEDEMADNGITMLSVKVRVMPERLLLLSRLFMRLDGVLVRIRDTRIYVEFATGDVVREYVAREEGYEVVKRVSIVVKEQPEICGRWLTWKQKLETGRDDALALLRDPNRLAEILPIADKTLEQVIVKGTVS